VERVLRPAGSGRFGDDELEPESDSGETAALIRASRKAGLGSPCSAPLRQPSSPCWSARLGDFGHAWPASSWLAGLAAVWSRRAVVPTLPWQQLSRYRVCLPCCSALEPVVLSRRGRLYDPLLHCLPLASLLGAGPASAAWPWRSTDLRQPGPDWRFAPGPGVDSIASCHGCSGLAHRLDSSPAALGVLGSSCLLRGQNILLNGQVLVVDASCTGGTPWRSAWRRHLSL